MAILGIDLGTTNSLVGVVDSGFPILLADREGQRLTPSVVSFPEDGSAPIVGREAQRRRLLHPGRTVVSVKRLMGKRFEEIEPERFSFLLAGAPGKPVEVAIPYGGAPSQSPAEVSAHILRHLAAIAEAALETPCRQAVITVPAYFNDAQRQATKRAGELAGLVVERIVNEPTAAALSFGLHRAPEATRIAVYDFGGGTFDISVLEIREGVFHVLSTAGDTDLGGDDIDHALARHFWKCFDPEGGPLGEQPVDTQIKFFQEAERAKRALTGAVETRVELPFAVEERHFQMTLTREKLEALARPFVERTLKHCRKALADAKVDVPEIDQVVLVGGSTRMPLVRRLVSEHFEREVNTSEHPDESVAMGAVIQGGILSGSLRNVVLLDVTPLSLGIESFGGLMNVIIPRNSTIPVKAGEMFTNAVASQESMRIRVLQGERELAKDNWELGQVDIHFTPGPKGSARIGVQFAIDENGILEVLARNTITQEDTVLQIRDAAVDVDDAQVEAMIAASVDHAFEDMEERLHTEARLKSEELLPAVAQALASIGDELETEERGRIEAAADAVRAALAGKDLPRLKEANAALDEATQHLAALLMDKAMQAALEKRGLL